MRLIKKKEVPAEFPHSGRTIGKWVGKPVTIYSNRTTVTLTGRTDQADVYLEFGIFEPADDPVTRHQTRVVMSLSRFLEYTANLQSIANEFQAKVKEAK